MKQNSLLVLGFDDTEEALAVGKKLQKLQKQDLIKIEDAALAIRDDSGRTKIKQLNNLVGAGALGGAFWGLLFGVIFFAPWLGMVVGAGAGALGGKLSDIGIDDDFIKEVGEEVGPGETALFLMISDVTVDKVLMELKSVQAKVIRTNLNSVQEALLREYFSTDVDLSKLANM